MVFIIFGIHLVAWYEDEKSRSVIFYVMQTLEFSSQCLKVPKRTTRFIAWSPDEFWRSLSGAVSRRHVYAITHHTCAPKHATYNAQYRGGKNIIVSARQRCCLSRSWGRNKAAVVRGRERG